MDTFWNDFVPGAEEFCKKLEDEGGQAIKSLLKEELTNITESRAETVPMVDFETKLVESKSSKELQARCRSVRNLADAVRTLRGWEAASGEDLFARSKTKDAEKNIKTSLTCLADLATGCIDAKGSDATPADMGDLWVKKMKDKLAPLKKLVGAIPPENFEKNYMKYFSAKNTSSSEAARMQKDVEQTVQDVLNAGKRMGNEKAAEMVPDFNTLNDEAKQHVDAVKGSMRVGCCNAAACPLLPDSFLIIE
jgi:hypothetical protein